jgi:hypothetical protein
LDECVSSIFRIEEQFKKVTNMKQAAIQASKLYLQTLGSLFNPEDGGDWFVQIYMLLYKGN